MAKSFAVLGLGRFGREMALQLARGGGEVLVVDNEQKDVDEIGDRVTRAVCADVRDRDALQELGVAECDEVILSVGSDLAVSVLTVMNLKALGVKHLICKAYDDVYREVLLKLGADRVVIPEQESAVRTAARLLSPRIRDYIQLTEDFSIEEISVPANWVGKTLGGLSIRNRYRVNVIAIRRGEKVMASPGADDRIAEGDMLLVLGEEKDLANVRKIK